MESYGFAKDMGKSEIVAEMFRMYEKLVAGHWEREVGFLLLAPLTQRAKAYIFYKNMTLKRGDYVCHAKRYDC